MSKGVHIYPTRPLADWLKEMIEYTRDILCGDADKRLEKRLKRTLPLDARDTVNKRRKHDRAFVRPNGVIKR